MNAKRSNTIYQRATRVPFGQGLSREAASDLVDVGFVFDVLRREKRLILGLVAGTVVLAFIAVQRMDPVYVSQAQVLLETRQERVLNEEQVVSNLTMSNSVMAGEVQLIRSNMLMGAVVDELGLTEHPDYDPRAPDEAGIVKRFVRGIRAVLLGGSKDDTPLTEEEIRAETIENLQKDVTVSQVGISFAILISARASSAELSAQIANTVASQYVETQIAMKRTATLRASGWLEDRVAELSRQLQEADGAVVAFRNDMTEQLGGDAEGTELLLAELNSRYIATKIDQADAAFRYQMVRDMYETGGFSAVADIVSSPLLETLTRERTELARSRAEMMQNLGDRNRRVVGMSAQIEDLERSIEAELLRQIESIRSELDMANNREASLLQAMETIQQRMARVSAATITLDQMERSATAIRETYESTLTRFMQTAAQTEFQRPDAQLISVARPPSSPAEPRKMILLMIAAFLALSAGTVVAFVREALNKSVRSSESLRQLSNLPVISLVPHVPHTRRDRSWMLQEIRDNPQSLFMESIRTMRVKLFDVHSKTRPKVLMVTSSVAGEGKTSTCVMLAHSLAQASLAVVVVDTDMRRSVSAKEFGSDPNGGCLVDYLSGKIGMNSLIQHLPDLEFDMVLPLRSVSNSGDLIASRKFSEELLPTLSAHYDVVIIDTAPVLAVSDVLLIARMSDATLLLVQPNHTASAVVKESLQRLDEAGAFVVGTALSKVRPKDAVSSEIYEYTSS